MNIQITNALPILITPIGDQQCQAVDLRKVHEWLEVKSRFNDWITKRISDYGFELNVDYISVTQKRVVENFNNLETTVKDYYATLNMAKELCMVERTDKGREARQYFLECERVARQQQPKLPQNYLEALEALVVSEKEKLALEVKVKEDEPKVQFHDDLQSQGELCSMNDYAALLLSANGIDIGRNRLLAYLRDAGYLMKGTGKGEERNKPYQKYRGCGYFRVKYNMIPTGERRCQPYITVKGMKALNGEIIEHFSRDESNVIPMPVKKKPSSLADIFAPPQKKRRRR